MHEIVGVLSARGGASLGDKTVLDSIDAVDQMLNTANDDDNLRDAAQRAAEHALGLYRHKPNRIGRARMFTEKSVCLDDPGMIALLRMIESV
ncbi:MAG: Putative dihydroxyacetone kinase (EC, ADP-binding subunit [uncultured Caballeronia sp.]|nr:MAG: Putative dihydroxyacetone kinase (EC, ADP-binding subunit [uncultured Caballeronia sp.]